MDLKDLKVLIVDDHMLMRNLLQQFSGNLGITDTAFCSSGDEALERLGDDAFNIVMADLNMPGMSGQELLTHIRKNPKYDRMAFIMITAEGETDTMLQIMNAGATSYITKPVSQATLAEHLDKVLQWLRQRM